MTNKIEHSPLPWITSPCGEMCPDDIMIYADLGKNEMGVQMISTVGKVLSLRQSKEVTAANAALIVRAVNAHAKLVAALEFYRAAFQFHPKRSSTGIDLSAWLPKTVLLEDCGETARAVLASLKE